MEVAKNRFVKIDGSGYLLPGKQHVHSLRAGVGSSITTHGVRMKLGHENNYSSSVKLHDYKELVLVGHHRGGKLSFCVRLLHEIHSLS